MEKNVVRGRGIGFCGLLTIAFIVLKLCGVIAWSWWAVLSPMLISIGLTFVLMLAVLVIALIKTLND